MKQIISKLRKCLCLALSIFLLTSNIQVFGQEVNNLLNQPSFEELTQYRYKFDKFLRSLRFDLNESYISQWLTYSDISLLETLKNYEYLIQEEDKILSYARSLDMINKGEMDIMDIIVHNKYLSNDSYKMLSNVRMQDEIVLNKLKELVKFFNAVALEHNIEGTKTSLVNFIDKEKREEFINCINYFENRFDESFYKYLTKEIDRRKIYGKMTGLFSKSVKPKDVLEYAYKNGMLPKEKAGVKLTLEAMDADVSVNSLVKSIRKYLTDFGTKIKDVKYYTKKSLVRELEGMTLAERTKYVDELTELQSGSKEFIKDFNKLDRPAKRYVGKNIIHGTWVSIGLIAGLTLLFELIPQNSNANNINKSFEIVDALDDISYKIENGEATMPEMLYFYTIPENENLILKDPVHTLNFVKLTEGVMAAEELLEAEKEAKQEANEEVENSILKKYMEIQQNKKGNVVGNVNVADFSF